VKHEVKKPSDAPPPAPIADAKTTLNKKELLKFEKRLLEEKMQILRQRGYTGAMLTQVEENSEGDSNGNVSDSGDQGYDTYQRELASRMTSGQSKNLMEIDEALRRVVLKRYGMCESCGKAIAQARLELVPHTRYCMKCLREKEAAVAPVVERKRGRRR
jgi:DnaK suppressor protein